MTISLAKRRLIFELALRVAAAVPLMLSGGYAMAQDWPTKPIRLIVGSGGGGAPDILARILSPHLLQVLGQPIVIDLKPGSGGVIAGIAMMNAPPDGYTWMLAATSNLAVTPYLKRQLPYDTFNDFIPVAMIAKSANVLVVSKQIGATNMSELLRIVRASPDKINYGSAGVGTPAHLGGELLSSLAGLEMVHIPYKGAAQALNDVVSGQIGVMITSPLAAKTYLSNDLVRVLATTGTTPDPLFPQLPTVNQSVPGYELTQWWGIVLRAGTPAPIIERVQNAVIAALGDPHTQELLTQQGVSAQPMRSDEFSRFVDTERKRYSELIKRVGIQVED